MLKSIAKSVNKEFRRMLKGKMILTVVTVIPILVGLLVGFEFENHQISHIPMGVADSDNSSLSRMIVQQFRENEIFDIRYQTDDTAQLKSLMDQSRIRVGMVIPKGFSEDLKALKSPKILMLYDGSQISITAAAKTKANEILMTLRAGMLMKFIEGKMNAPAAAAEKMVQAVGFQYRKLNNPTGSFRYFLNPGLATGIVQSGIVLMAAVSVKRNEMGQEWYKKAGYILGKVLFYCALGTITLVANILVQNRVFHIPLRGNSTVTLLLSIAFSLAVASFGVMVSVWVSDRILATIISAVLFIPSPLFTGYTWPVISMPGIYRAVVPFMPFYHYANNIRNLFLNEAVYTPGIMKDIRWLYTFALITLSIAFLGTLILRTNKDMPGMMPVEGGE